MKTFFATLIISALVTFLVTPFVRRLAFRFGAVDAPSSRKVHRGIIPRLGGIGVFLGILIPIPLIFQLDNVIAADLISNNILIITLVIGMSVILALGIWDDFKDAKPIVKLAFQTSVALILFFGGFRIESINISGGNEMQLPFILQLLLSLLWIVGITNAINLLDGIDGLVSGVAAFISLALAIINVYADQGQFIGVISIALAGACIGFLPYNFSPARIFLGDSGSLLIGVTLSCVGIKALFHTSSGNAGILIIPMILFGLPLFDTISVMITRARKGKSIFQADKNHVHHKLLRWGLSQKQASYLLYLVTATLSFIAIIFSWSLGPDIIMGGVCVLLALLFWIIWLWKLRNKIL